MCSSRAKVTIGSEAMAPVAKINGRPVLQPTCNRVPRLERHNSLKKLSTPPQANYSNLYTKASSMGMGALTSPKSKSSRPQEIKRGNDETNGLLLNSSCVPKPKSYKEGGKINNGHHEDYLSYSSSMIVESPGSIAAVRREQMALEQQQRKMKIAHYGRSKSARFELRIDDFDIPKSCDIQEDHKRCSFITPNSDPIYVAYHDEEWGVPVHDDKLLFELLVLSGAQVGSDWTSILKKRQIFRDAFSGFDAETIANFTDRQISSISAQYAIDINRVRGIVDNSKQILEIKKEFGSLEKYIWGFVNHKPISTNYKFGHKIQAKTSKSETISKDMVRRGFRFVGPTMVHSFMQAAGLTNDHLITCHRHLPCALFSIARAKGGELIF